MGAEDNQDRQSMATEAIKKGESIFVSGPAGTGKSYVASKVQTDSTLVAAPTGIAALNVGGTTIHKAFGLPIGLVTEEDFGPVPDSMFDLFSKAGGVETIQLDEAGMIRADYFELIDYRLRQVRGNDEPFGGIQVTAFGDFFQLEPILTESESRMFYDVFDSPYCFDSDSWILDTFELKKVYRQSDIRQVKILNSLRTGDKHSLLALQRLREECPPYENTEDTLHLCCYKKDAKEINQHWFSKIRNRTISYKAWIEGNEKWFDAPVDFVIELKKGAKVLLCANNPEEGYVNGDRGEVLELMPSHVKIRLLNGKEVKVVPNKWTKYDYRSGGNGLERVESGSYRQMPIKLAYAITIHSSQGLTLDKVALHLGKGCFSAGQLYVGISRIKNIQDLSFVRQPRRTDLKVSERVKKFYKEVEEKSRVR